MSVKNYQVLVRLALAAVSNGDTELASNRWTQAAAVSDDAHRHLTWQKRFESLNGEKLD